MKNFITFEGCEGSGKSTQIRLFKEYLDKSGVKYASFREPGGTEISEKIREMILDVKSEGMTNECEALLYAAARAQLIKEKILPALSEGNLVICDRYVDSSVAYQGYARGLGAEYVKKINDYAINACMPRFTVFLNISPTDAFLRKGGADENDRLERAGLKFHEEVYRGYLEIAKNESFRFLLIDCGGTKWETNKKIITALKDRGVI